jgi:RNA 2',3'-cyclic 3'-phosphodiesterase
MPEQFDLPGFGPAPAPPSTPNAGPRPRGSSTLFFALLPPADALSRIVDLRALLRTDEQLSGRPIDADRLHITLIDLGGFDEPPPAVLESAMRAAASIRVPPFEIVFNRALSFARRIGKPPFVLCGPEMPALAAFCRSLADAVDDAGLWRHEAQTPHVTLLYDARTVIERPVEPVRWAAESFVLVQSLVGRGIHRRLGEWPFGT